MFKKILGLFRRKEKLQPNEVHLRLFAVQTHVVLKYNGSRVDTFTAMIHAQSKSEAKEIMEREAQVKVGTVLNKRRIRKVLKRKD